MGRCRQQKQMLLWFSREPTDQMVALLLCLRCSGRTGARMRFIDDHQFRALFDEDIAPYVRLDEVDADDLVRIEIVNARVSLDLPIKARLRV